MCWLLPSGIFRWLSMVVVAVMLAVIFRKGTSPGGPDEWHEFRGVRDSNRDS